MQALRDAAQAVLDRWDSPAWEWHQGPTAALMAGLRRALLDIEKFCDTHCTWSDHHPDCVHSNAGSATSPWRESAAKGCSPVGSGMPAPRSPLTENQIRDALKNDPAGQELVFLINTEPTVEQFIKAVIGIARAIERAHGIKEDG